MICFQKIVSLFWRTTCNFLNMSRSWLWFAFKKLYLCSDEQHASENLDLVSCCDLLSKNCIFVLTNNKRASFISLTLVVICFQKIVSLFWRTTGGSWRVSKSCCDLLSKNCIFVLTNNKITYTLSKDIVVICFQKIVSLFWRTTLFVKLPWENCCDLLSKNCIFVLTNNMRTIKSRMVVVVICFQKIVSLFWRTTCYQLY